MAKWLSQFRTSKLFTASEGKQRNRPQAAQPDGRTTRRDRAKEHAPAQLLHANSREEGTQESTKTGPDAGKPRPGIYRLDGKVLTVCLAYPGHPRPTAFVAGPEVQQVRVYRQWKAQQLRGRRAESNSP